MNYIYETHLLVIHHLTLKNLSQYNIFLKQDKSTMYQNIINDNIIELYYLTNFKQIWILMAHSYYVIFTTNYIYFFSVIIYYYLNPLCYFFLYPLKKMHSYFLIHLYVSQMILSFFLHSILYFMNFYFAIVIEFNSLNLI